MHMPATLIRPKPLFFLGFLPIKYDADELTIARCFKALRPSNIRNRILSRAVNVTSIGQECLPISSNVEITHRSSRRPPEFVTDL
jgi:hypothetical protein